MPLEVALCGARHYCDLVGKNENFYQKAQILCRCEKFHKAKFRGNLQLKQKPKFASLLEKISQI